MLHHLALAAGIVTLGVAGHAPDSETPITDDAHRVALVETFETDPRLSTDVTIEGAALERIAWRKDRPAFAGDRPGSLTARYDALADPGRFGFPLDRSLGAGDAWAAGFAFVIRSEGFSADPDGFFQLSVGLWNAGTTGLERTGTPESFASDAFDLVEWAYFPNVSASFGGPFFAPVILGSAVPDDPGFELNGAFVNAAFGFGPPVELPLDTPLIALIVNDPDTGEVGFHTFRIDGPTRFTEILAARTVVSTSFMLDPRFTLDTVGLTLWRDGFSGDTPSLTADVEFHAVAALSLPFVPARLRDLFPAVFGALR